MSRYEDDPRITAYVLGELDAAETTAFEAEIAAHPELAAEVEAFRGLAGELETGFAGGPEAGLTMAQRAKVVAATDTPAAAPMPRWMLMAALVLGVAVSVGIGLNLETGSASEKARPELAGEGRGAELLALMNEGDPRMLEEAKTDNELDFDDAVNGLDPKPVDGSTTRPAGLAPGNLDLQVDRTKKRSAFASGGSRSAGGGGGGHSTAGLPKDSYGRPRATSRWVTDGIGFGGGSGGRFYDGRVVPGGRIVPGVPSNVRPTGPGSEAYDAPRDNPFLETLKRHTSTFSLDVDTASYANVRRFLMHQGVVPPAGAVRIEELVNYFAYGYAPPAKDSKHPFATHVQIASCPWHPKRLLARVAIKGKVVSAAERPAANLVFLVDVSGSMKPENKLPLVKQGLRLLIDKLDERDRVAIVTYAGNAGVALASTSCAEKDAILAAIDKLEAGGSTNGEAGIELAYRLAKEGFQKDGINRVMLATDGDFNVGQTSRNALIEKIRGRAAKGTYLSILGFGMGNYKDGRMEALSNACDGTYAYIDNLAEAKKVLVEGVTGQLVPIAKDVKVQVFFNPRTVAAYRLIGYENRRLAAKDFNDDTKDAGDVGAGHTVTAFYEIVPVGQPMPGRDVDPNPFVKGPKEAEKPAEPAVEHATALFQLRLRYKQPDGDVSTLIAQYVEPTGKRFDETEDDFRFAAAVAAFGMKLRRSPHQGRIGWEAILEIAESAVGEDPNGRRSEFLQLVKKAKELMGS